MHSTTNQERNSNSLYRVFKVIKFGEDLRKVESQRKKVQKNNNLQQHEFRLPQLSTSPSLSTTVDFPQLPVVLSLQAFARKLILRQLASAHRMASRVTIVTSSVLSALPGVLYYRTKNSLGF